MTDERTPREAKESASSAVARRVARTAAVRRGQRRVEIMPVPFGGHAPRRDPERPGGDDERPVGTGQRLAEGLDGAAVGVGGALEVPGEGEVVLEREVDHAIRRGRGAPQAVEIVERAAHAPAPRRR